MGRDEGREGMYDKLTRTRIFWLRPERSFWSHWGVLPVSVAKWTSKPAFLKAVYGTDVSVGSWP